MFYSHYCTDLRQDINLTMERTNFTWFYFLNILSRPGICSSLRVSDLLKQFEFEIVSFRKVIVRTSVNKVPSAQSVA